MRFTLSARVSSDRPAAVKSVITNVAPGASVKKEGAEFIVQAELQGADAKELNRAFLSALRRVEKKTRLRAEWTAEDGVTYRFFDYVLKKSVRTRQVR